mmetsp:Transcript_741/g.1169  ORF Transcript_741/g.1169 Transcript_741/m.1169 type:complete len:234 (+) Transcript_741:42-743(+)
MKLFLRLIWSTTTCGELNRQRKELAGPAVKINISRFIGLLILCSHSIGHIVTICFVYTVGLEDDPSTKSRNLLILAKYVRKQMLSLNPPGYECQEDNGCWMLAFDRMVNAVFFGLQLKNVMQDIQGLSGNVDRDNMFKVGVLSGPFTSMGPHRTTGMADYFGPIVNRAARVCSNCEKGQVCVGIPLAQGVTADPPDFGDTVTVRWQGNKKLKGITIDMAIFACSMGRIQKRYR